MVSVCFFLVLYLSKGGLSSQSKDIVRENLELLIWKEVGVHSILLFRYFTLNNIETKVSASILN